MTILIWAGAALTLCGVAMLLWCVLAAFKAKRSGAPDDELRARLRRVVLINTAALGLSVLGLMAVILGISMI